MGEKVDRRWTLLFMALLLAVQTAVYFVKVYPLSGYGRSVKARAADTVCAEGPFDFDPNVLDSAGFVRLGFSPRQASVIVRYRRAGGRFRRVEDLERLYVVDTVMYRRLAGYVRIDYSALDAEKDRTKEKGLKGGGSVRVSGGAGMSGSRKVYGTGRRVSAGVRLRRPVDLNAADSAALDSLPGIGPYFAARIIEYRERLGFFCVKEQLLEISGFSEERFRGLERFVTVSEAEKMSLAEADSVFLVRHPYIGYYRYTAIMDYFRFRGASAGIGDVLEDDVIETDREDMLVRMFE